MFMFIFMPLISGLIIPIVGIAGMGGNPFGLRNGWIGLGGIFLGSSFFLTAIILESYYFDSGVS